MGRRDRERVERINAGLEKPISDINRKMLSNPVARKAVALASRKGIVEELSKGSVDEQTGRLDELVGTGVLPTEKLKQAIMRKAPKEMDKAIKKFRKQGKNITVDSLCSEIRSESGFLDTCERMGLNIEWFEKLAKERMEVHGL